MSDNINRAVYQRLDNVTIEEATVDNAPRLVIAIDFGTFASGYALQWRTDFTNDRLKIHANTKWTSGGFCTYKTPTCLLLKPDQSVSEFGYRAEAKYCGLADEGENPDNWFFFRNFKMILYRVDGDIDANTPVEGAQGKHLSARIVFSKSIGYMKDHAIKHLKDNGLPYPEAETKWVLTVPAIWADPAKSIMREAAQAAGIRGDNLTIALEPECAAIYCSQLPSNQLEIEGDGGKLEYVAAPGSTIMVVDMGGGTVDITTVKINDDSTMDHVQMSGGGPWGGMRVDDKFMMLIRDIVGASVAEQFVSENQIDEYDLRMEFESRKREVKHPSEPDSNERFRIRLPESLKQLWQRANDNKSVVEIIRGREDLREKGIKFASGRLSFDSKIVQEFFREAVRDIIGYINRTMAEPNVEGLVISSLIVVGGFAMSSYVVQSLREGLRDRGIPVVRPQSTELAVLNGAVLFGQNEEIMTSRIMRHTYGVAFTMEFDNKKHKAGSKYEADGKVWANNVFRKHVTRGESVKLGTWIADKEYYPVDDAQTSATVYIYTSDQSDPFHTNDSGCRYIGKFDVEFPVQSPGQQKIRRAVEISMNFSGTELKVRAFNRATQKQYKKSLRLR